eukprot:9479305-Pyramimonas_sp.AAC.1
MQRILSMKAEPHHGREYDLTAVTPERKRHRAEEPEIPGAPKKEKNNSETELADEGGTWRELGRKLTGK